MHIASLWARSGGFDGIYVMFVFCNQLRPAVRTWQHRPASERTPRRAPSHESEVLPVPTTIGFNHVATLTPDLDRLVEFYVSVFDAAVTDEMAAQPEHPRMVVLDLGGGAALNAFEVPDDEIVGERGRQGGRGAIDHYALAVDSLATLEQVKERLVAAGADIGEIQRLGAEWSLFFRDPDGMELEVCCSAS